MELRGIIFFKIKPDNFKKIFIYKNIKSIEFDIKLINLRKQIKWREKKY